MNDCSSSFNGSEEMIGKEIDSPSLTVRG